MCGEPVVQITAYQPEWSVWWGRRTGTYWAAPTWSGAPDEVIEAPDVVSLDDRMTEIEDTWAERWDG